MPSYLQSTFADAELVPSDSVVLPGRLEATHSLDEATAGRRLPRGGAERLAKLLAEAQEGAESCSEVNALRWIDDLEDSLHLNRMALTAAPDLFPPQRMRVLVAEANARYGCSRALLQQRARTGSVRSHGGKSPLDHIYRLVGGGLAAISDEAEEAPAVRDVLYELALLLLDLYASGLDGEANRVFNGYLAQTDRQADLEDLDALSLFLLIGATTRARLAAKRRNALALAAAPRSQVAAAEFDARRYLRFAERLLEAAPPCLVAIGGLSGTGKSTTARALAPGVGGAPGAVILRADVERKLLYEVSPNDRLPPEAYCASVSREVYDRLMDKATAALTAGRSVIVDAVFARPHERADCRRLACALAVPFQGIWLEADMPTMLRRVERRHDDASDATTEIVRQQTKFRTGVVDWARIDSQGSTSDIIRQIDAALGSSASAAWPHLAAG